MAEQLDLFGDYIPDPEDETNNLFHQQEEAEYDSDQIAHDSGEMERLGADGARPLEALSPDLLQDAPGAGATGRENHVGLRDNGRQIGGIVGGRAAHQRGKGDPSTTVHSSATGSRPADAAGGGLEQTGSTDSRGNFHINSRLQDTLKTPVERFEANIAALKCLQGIDERQNHATPHEQAVLSRYTGWGGLNDAFSRNSSPTWQARQTELKSLLSQEDFNSLTRSTLDAYYTPNVVVESLWSAVRRMGYNGGPTLEPATGTGQFFGLRPKNIPIEMHGIELDPTSGRIAQHLYRSATIRISGFEDIKIPEEHYNLIISNVPFGDHKPYELKANQTPSLDGSYSIHDFYFLKSLHGLREGGVIAFVTSRHMMDKESTEIRQKVADQADFLGAIRLPNDTFSDAGTAVISDVVFLQKREKGVEPSPLTTRFVEAQLLSIQDYEGNEAQVAVNTYFHDNPHMVLGQPRLVVGRFGPEYTVEPNPRVSLEAQLAEAVNTLPEAIMTLSVEQRTQKMDESVPYSSYTNFDLQNLPRGSFYIGDDQRLYQKSPHSDEITLTSYYNDEKTNLPTINRIKRMTVIRDTVREAFDHHSKNDTLETHRAISRLNVLYDAFVDQYGPLNDRKNTPLFGLDPDYSLLCSLENWDRKTKTATKADIFDGITFESKTYPTSVEFPLDAMIVSLSRYGRIDLGTMEKMTGLDRETFVPALIDAGHIYQDPYDFVNHSRTTYLPADAYLSGNIRIKIQQAQEAARQDPARFSRNVHDLTNIMPKPLAAQDISLRMNSPVVGQEHVQDFVADLLGVRKRRVDVLHVPITGKWEINVDFVFSRRRDTANTETFGTSRMDAVKIINALMNGKPVKVYDKAEDGSLVLNTEDTNAAELKAEAIQTAFSAWVWRDQERTDDIVQRYNELFNSSVPRKYTHPERLRDPNAQIRLPGCAYPHPLRSHQADAVWRNVQQNNTMFAHAVGAGKTLEMTCSAMEMRRLGLRSKPMIVCPDHMIGQWAKEFRQAYPTAKLLVADDMNWNKQNRRTFINRIATGDWDAVIIRGQSFKMIPISAEYQTKFFKEKIAEYRDILDATDESNKKKRSVKDLQKAVTNYENKIKELSDATHDEGVIPFDRLGVDHLFIDEADLFKNLEYYTQLQNVRGMGTPVGSERALDMLMKVRHVQSMDGGITFATGTPISNTLVETYTMQRFLQPETLEQNGLKAFDEWARQYAEPVTQMELNNTGTGYRPVTRFSKIVNVPELVTSLRSVWDIKTAHNLENDGILVPGINLPNMQVINALAPSTPLLRSYLQHLEEREGNPGNVDPSKPNDNVLAIMTDGRKAAVDMRLINPNLPDDPNSKLNLAVKLIHDVYTKYADDQYTCAVFFDKARSKDVEGNVIFDGVAEMKRKLIELGVKPNEIGLVRDCNNYTQRQELFDRVRDGRCRVIFGSTESMGAGTNFQDKLKAIVHIDAPYRPRDIEQQNGRGYRCGNKTGTLEVYNCATKGSLDSGLWSMLETKANSIRQVMDGSDNATRELEEDYFGSVKELSIENPIMKEVMELDHSLRKLHSQERAFTNENAHAHRRLQTLPGEIERAQQQCFLVEKDISARLPEAKGEAFTITLDGKQITDRTEAGEILKQQISTMFLQAKASGQDMEREIGSYAGLKLTIKTTLHDFQMGTACACGQSFRYPAAMREDSNPVGLCNSLHKAVYSGMERHLATSQQSVNTLQQQMESYTALKDATFPKADELSRKEARYTQCMAILAEEAKAKPTEDQTRKEAIPWSKFHSMTPNEIQQSVETFLVAQDPQPEPIKSSIIQGAEEIETGIFEKHGLKIPPSVTSALHTAIEQGVLKPEQIHREIDALVQAKHAHFQKAWHMTGNPKEVYASLRADPTRISTNDIIIASKNRDSSTEYRAFRVVDSVKKNYLGTEVQFEAIKTRSEQYVTTVAIRDMVNAEISKNKKGPSLGLEL